jgi:putative ABC transport system ATP-binding protein
MKELNHQEGTTFIFSTHDHRVMERADRIIRIEDGKIVDDGKRGPRPPASAAALGASP